MVVPVVRLRANTSAVPLPSPSTRFEAFDVNPAMLPSAEIESAVESPFAPEPSLPWLTSMTRPVAMSLRNTSTVRPLRLPPSRSVASESNST